MILQIFSSLTSSILYFTNPGAFLLPWSSLCTTVPVVSTEQNLDGVSNCEVLSSLIFHL